MIFIDILLQVEMYVSRGYIKLARLVYRRKHNN